jgi:hypothetical protein
MTQTEFSPDKASPSKRSTPAVQAAIARLQLARRDLDTVDRKRFPEHRAIVMRRIDRLLDDLSVVLQR